MPALRVCESKPYTRTAKSTSEEDDEDEGPPGPPEDRRLQSFTGHGLPGPDSQKMSSCRLSWGRWGPCTSKRLRPRGLGFWLRGFAATGFGLQIATALAI